MKTQPSFPTFEPAEPDIQHCAYFLWKEEGCPSGRDLDLWLAAKELLRHRVAVPAPARRKKCASMANPRGAGRRPLR